MPRTKRPNGAGELYIKHGSSRLQAADSLSFLEVNAHRARASRCGRVNARSKRRAKLDWTLERMSIPAARALAEPLDARAVDTLAG